MRPMTTALAALLLATAPAWGGDTRTERVQFLMRSAARRGEVAKYRLEMIVD